MGKQMAVIPLDVKLTETELLEAGEKLTKKMIEKEVKEYDFEKIKSTHKANIKIIEDDISQLCIIVNNKSERRPVKCEIRYDFTNNIKSFYRTDTGELVMQEAMTESDRQENFEAVIFKDNDNTSSAAQ